MKEKQKYVYVKFEKSDQLYLYKTDLDCKKGYIVEAPVCNYLLKERAIVDKVVFFPKNKIPIAKNRILEITKILSDKPDPKQDKKYAHLKYIKNYAKFDYLQEWKYEGSDGYTKCWKSDFGYSLSYQKDGTLEVFFFDPKTEYDFCEYTITSPKNLNYKIAYAETLVSQFYHKEISHEQFNTLFARINPPLDKF